MFTPIETTLGALLLHLSTSTLLLSNSETLGASSLLASNPTVLAGLLASAPLSLYLLPPTLLPTYPPPRTILAPILIGLGSSLAAGCTSGHFLCGSARLSRRSLVATASFCVSAALTTFLLDTAPGCVGAPCYTATYPSLPTTLLLSTIVAAAATGQYVISQLPETEVSRNVARAYAGVVFGLGLLISGMAGSAKTLGFLAVGRWEKVDPSLAIVAVVGVGGNMVRWWNAGVGKNGTGPWLTKEGWKLPGAGKRVDLRLVLGAVLFGVGWGLEGVCPGPGYLKGMLGGWDGIKWVSAFLGSWVVGRWIPL